MFRPSRERDTHSNSSLNNILRDRLHHMQREKHSSKPAMQNMRNCDETTQNESWKNLKRVCESDYSSSPGGPGGVTWAGGSFGLAHLAAISDRASGNILWRCGWICSTHLLMAHFKIINEIKKCCHVDLYLFILKSRWSASLTPKCSGAKALSLFLSHTLYHSLSLSPPLAKVRTMTWNEYVS